MRCILGIDGGGTKTRALLIDENGEIIGRGKSGPSNFHSIGLDQAVANIADCIGQAVWEAYQLQSGQQVQDHDCQENYASMLEISQLVLGLAGVGRPGDHARMLEALQHKLKDNVKKWLAEQAGIEQRLKCDNTSQSEEPEDNGNSEISRVCDIGNSDICTTNKNLEHKEYKISPINQFVHNLIPNDITLTTDAQIALVGAVAGGDGIVVIAGTGAIAFGTKAGRVERAGGWGYLLDDRGSGYDLGREAIVAALRGFDGRGPATSLAEEICAYLGIAQLADIIAPVYSGQYDRTKIAELSTLVVESANTGDSVAQEILRTGGRELALAAIAVATRLDLTDCFMVAGTGGILSNRLPFLYPAFVDEIKHKYPEAEVTDPALEPVYGALVMGAQKMGLPIQPMIRRWYT